MNITKVALVFLCLLPFHKAVGVSTIDIVDTYFECQPSASSTDTVPQIFQFFTRVDVSTVFSAGNNSQEDCNKQGPQLASKVKELGKLATDIKFSYCAQAPNNGAIFETAVILSNDGYGQIRMNPTIEMTVFPNFDSCLEAALADTTAWP